MDQQNQREQLLIIGTGGHSKVCIDIAKKQFDIVGLIGQEGESGEIEGFPIVGNDNDVARFFESGIRNAFIAIGSNVLREKLALNMIEMGYKLVNLISEHSLIADSVKLGQGNLIMHGAIINPATIIGNNCIVNTNANIDHDCVVSDNVHIAPGTHIAGKVNIGKNSFVGIGSSIIPEITIGENVTLGAGSVVVNDIPDNSKAYGVPAKVVS